MRTYSLVWFPISESQREWGLGTRPLRERGLGMRQGAAKVQRKQRSHREIALESRSAVYPHRTYFDQKKMLVILFGDLLWYYDA